MATLSVSSIAALIRRQYSLDCFAARGPGAPRPNGQIRHRAMRAPGSHGTPETQPSWRDDIKEANVPTVAVDLPLPAYEFGLPGVSSRDKHRGKESRTIGFIYRTDAAGSSRNCPAEMHRVQVPFSDRAANLGILCSMRSFRVPFLEKEAVGMAQEISSVWI